MSKAKDLLEKLRSSKKSKDESTSTNVTTEVRKEKKHGSKSMKLRTRIKLLTIVPVIMASIIILIGISITIPKEVNTLKQDAVEIQGEQLVQNLNLLTLEAENSCTTIANEETIVDALEAKQYEGVTSLLMVSSRTVWNTEADDETIPDVIFVTNSDAEVISTLFYDKDNGIFKRTGSNLTNVQSEELTSALNGRVASGYSKSDLSDLTLTTSAPLFYTRTLNNSDELDDGEDIKTETEVIGTVSIGYMLDSEKYVDLFKGDKDIEISFLLEGKRAATTFMKDDVRSVDTAMENSIYEEAINTKSHVLTESNILGKEYITNYEPLMVGENVFAIMELAVEGADLTGLYITMLIIVAAIIIFVTIVTTASVNKSISAPINSLVEAANTLAEGNVNVKLESSTTDDEIGALTQAFLTMAANNKEQAIQVRKITSGDLTIDVQPKSKKALVDNSLKEMVDTNNVIFAEMIASAEQVAVAAKQIADGSQALSQGTTEQASAIEELSESISKIAAKTKLNAENANKSNKLINEVLDSAKQGTANMDEMVSSVQEISKASNYISKVIKVIDDIAFQTNILALNAAVEAARAGEYGKGFAVVAEEVRNLAAKSAKAANETTDMIENSINKAKEGEEIAKKTSESFDGIVSGVEQISGVISEIDTASVEQTMSITEVNQDVEQVSKVVQTNAATAEESAASSEEMSSQAIMLKDMISNKFKLKNADESINDTGKNKATEGVDSEIYIDDKDDFGKY